MNKKMKKVENDRIAVKVYLVHIKHKWKYFNIFREKVLTNNTFGDIIYRRLSDMRV